MKKRVCNALSVIGFLAIFLILLSVFTQILSRKDSARKFHDLKTEKNDIDVLFFGSSHVINGVFPMELWKEFGMTSYNCGGHTLRLPGSYWLMMNVLDKVQPKLIVVDMFYLEREEKIPGKNEVYLYHDSFDWLDLSPRKIRAVNDLFSSPARRLEFLMPITLYHGRWRELERGDIIVRGTLEKGAEYRVACAEHKDFETIDADEMETADSVGKQYLRKMIEECQKRGIGILLINLPYRAETQEQRWANSAKLIAGEYGIDFLNLQYADTGVDFETDLYDTGHLNPSGARKITAYLGEYIKTHYEIPDHSGEASYAAWNDSYGKYADFKWRTLRENDEDLHVYLSLLADRNLDLALYIDGGSELFEEERMRKLILNLAPLRDVRRAWESGENYAAFINNSSGDVAEYPDESKVRRILEQNGLLKEDGTMPQIAVVSYDSRTGETVDRFSVP